MGLDVELDQECSVARRCRHAQTIFKTISKYIDCASDLESNSQVVAAKSTNLSEIPVLQVMNDQQQDGFLVHNKSLPQSLPSDSPVSLTAPRPF